MAVWLPLDSCPSFPPCEIRVNGATGGGLVGFVHRCAYHDGLLATVADDAGLYSAILHSEFVREAARAAAKQSLGLDKEHPGVPFRIEADGSFTLGLDRRNGHMPEWPRTAGQARTRLATAIADAIGDIPKPLGTSTVTIG